MFATYQRLNLWIWATDLEVVRAASRKVRVRFGRGNRHARHAFYRAMIARHHEAQDMARSWRL